MDRDMTVLLIAVAIVAYLLLSGPKKKTNEDGPAIGKPPPPSDEEAAVGAVGAAAGVAVCTATGVGTAALPACAAVGAWGAKVTYGAAKELITGTSGSQFHTWDETDAFAFLQGNMSCCYHGNKDCCAAVQAQAPGTVCRLHDCDEHIRPVARGTSPEFVYNDSRQANRRGKIIRGKWANPCQADANHTQYELNIDDPTYLAYLRAGGSPTCPPDRGNVTIRQS